MAEWYANRDSLLTYFLLTGSNPSIYWAHMPSKIFLQFEHAYDLPWVPLYKANPLYKPSPLHKADRACTTFNIFPVAGHGYQSCFQMTKAHASAKSHVICSYHGSR